MNLAQKIKALRMERGMTQKELAIAAGISLIYVKRLESGKYEPSSIHRKLSLALGVTVEDLIG